jgi:hypothetical protein
VREEHGRELRDDLAEARQFTAAVAFDILKASPAAHWDVLRQDITLAFRQMRRAPTFAAIACLTLAVGIGGNVAFFTLVDGVLLRQLPVAGADRIVDITEEHLGRNLRNFGISPANYRDVVRDTTIFQASAIFGGRSGTMRLGENRQRVSYTAVSGDFFRVFTESPIMGRVLRPDDDVAGASAILLSFDFWQGALGWRSGDHRQAHRRRRRPAPCRRRHAAELLVAAQLVRVLATHRAFQRRMGESWRAVGAGGRTPRAWRSGGPGGRRRGSHRQGARLAEPEDERLDGASWSRSSARRV